MAFWLTQYLKSRPPNFGQVGPTVYRSADPDDHLGRWVNTYRIEAVLDLRDKPDATEEAACERLGALYTRLPMRDDQAPTPATIRAALDVLRAGLVTLVHCAGGRHRTGVVVACYEVVNGTSKRDAWKHAEKFGWYDQWGHKPLRLWFEQQFKPEDYN